MSETDNNIQNQKPKISRMLIVFVVLAIFGMLGCGQIIPKYELEQAKAQVPTMREYALNQITGLTKQERTLIIEKEPGIGHSNYVLYHFWWTDEIGRRVFWVDSNPPSTGLGPIRAYRWQDKYQVNPSKQSLYGE